MKITLNQHEVQAPDAITLSHLLEIFGYQSGNFALALNGKFISKTNYPNHVIKPDDEIVIINPMQGG